MTDFQVGSPLREPLLKFLIRYPTQTVDFFLLQLSGSQMNRLLMVSTRQSEDLFIIVYVSYAKQEECLRNVLCENWYIIDRSIWGQAAIGLRSCWCPTLFCSRKFAFLPAAWVKTLCCLDNIIKVYKNVMVLFNVNNILFQYVLSQESSKPLRQTLEAHSLKLVNSTFSIPQVR